MKLLHFKKWIFDEKVGLKGQKPKLLVIEQYLINVGLWPPTTLFLGLFPKKISFVRVPSHPNWLCAPEKTFISFCLDYNPSWPTIHRLSLQIRGFLDMYRQSFSLLEFKMWEPGYQPRRLPSRRGRLWRLLTLYRSIYLMFSMFNTHTV